jgi:predicted regulator of Ras-like GTPase activity (Roadblock/LC7/MglB family)
VKEILDQLAAQVGVRLVAFVMDDGVPVLVREGAKGGEGIASTGGDTDALAALSAGWVLDVCSAIAPLAWDKPQRMALRGAQGTLVLRRAHTAWLLVILAEGLRVEDLVLAMDGTAARLARFVRGNSQTEAAARADDVGAPPPALPTARNEQGEARSSSFNTEQELPKGK